MGTSNAPVTLSVTLCVIIGVRSPFQSFMFSQVIWGIDKAWYTLNKVVWATAYPKLLLPQPLIPVDQFGSLYLIPSRTGDWFGVVRRRYCLVSSGSLVYSDLYPFHQTFAWYQSPAVDVTASKHLWVQQSYLTSLSRYIHITDLPEPGPAYSIPAIWHHGEVGKKMSKGLEQLNFRPDFVANCATLIK